MSEMPRPFGLKRRGNVWWFRVRVPKDLLESYSGRKELNYTLRTPDYEEAKVRGAQKWADVSLEFSRLRVRAAAKPSELALRTREDVAFRIRDYVNRQDQLLSASNARTEWTPESRDEALAEAAMKINAYADPFDENGQQDICIAARETFGADGFPPDLTPAQREGAWEQMRRGLLEVERRAVARLRADHSRFSFDALFPAPSPHAPTFGELCEEFANEYPKSSTAKSKRIARVKSDLHLIAEFFGPDTPVEEISLRRCRQFRDVLAVLPARIQQHFPQRKISLEEVVAEGKRRGLPSLSYETQSLYLATLKALGQFARTEGHAWNAEVRALKPLAVKVAPREQRLPFTPDQIVAIFSAPLYSKSPDEQPRARSANIAPETRFWVPLISLFSGLRLNEVCQLRGVDMQESETGTPYIAVSEDAPDQSAKTPNSVRSCPVHPELVRLGFLTFVEERKGAGHERLFPELRRSRDGYYSADFSKWFNRTLLPSTGAKTSRRDFHSFRHTFRDALSAIDTPGEVIDELAGWKRGEGMRARYGSSRTVDHLARFVSRVSYLGLDLSHLQKR